MCVFDFMTALGSSRWPDEEPQTAKLYTHTIAQKN